MCTCLCMHKEKYTLSQKAYEVMLVCTAFVQMHPQPNSPSHTHQTVMSLIKELYAVCSKAPAG